MATARNFSRSVQGASEEAYDYICTSCESRNNTSVEAKHYCADCGDFYCVTCLDFHKALPALKNHKVFGRDEVKNWGKQKKSASVPTEPCPRHSSKILEMHCGNHDALCCHVCVSLDHRTCVDMQFIPDVARGINQSPELKKVKQNLDSIQTDVVNMKNTKEQSRATLERSRKEALECIKECRKRANIIFDQLEKTATADMDKHHRNSTSSIHDDIKACDDILSELQQVKQKLQTTSPNNESQVFINVKTCQQHIDEGVQMMKTVSTTPRNTSFKFIIDPTLENTISNLKRLGKVEVRLTTPEVKMATSEVKMATSEVKKQQKIQLYTAQNERNYNIKIKGDKSNCYISGCCQMPDGTILVADQRNRKLKQLNSSYQVTNHCDLPSEPNAVCCISGQEVVVSAYENNIYFVSVSRGKMAVTRSTKINHICWGLAYSNSQLYVTDRSNKVYIYNIAGTCLRTLDKDNNGVDMFSITQHIAVSPDGTKIYVADCGKGLVTLTTDGQLLSTFRDEELNRVWGVCVDGRGSVLVSKWDPQSVIQLDEEGKRKLGTVVSPMKYVNEYPSSMCVDRQNSRLIVTMYTLDDYNSLRGSGYDSVRVYDLQ